MNLKSPNEVNIPTYLRGKKVARTKRQRYKLYMSQGGFCCYCAKPMWLEGIHKPKEKNAKATLEHIKPKINGGGNGINNLKCSCLECNSYRSNISDEEFKVIRQMDEWKHIAIGYFRFVQTKRQDQKNLTWFHTFQMYYNQIDPNGFDKTRAMKMCQRGQFNPNARISRKRLRKALKTPMWALVKTRYRFVYA